MIEVIPNWHPFVVHFVIAPMVISSLCYILSLFPFPANLRSELLIVAKWSLYAAAISSPIAAITGWYAFNTVAHDEAGHAAMLLHRKAAIVSVALMFVSLGVFFLIRNKTVNVWFIVIVLVSTMSVLVTGYLGAENVYRHGIGVQRIPEIVNGVGLEDHSHHDHDH